jgi:hypothetical protein
MIFDPLGEQHFLPTEDQLRQLALDSAIVFRDRSFRLENSRDECRAYRALMRRQAILWRELPQPAGSQARF